MAETKIEWARYTFNPWRGCSKVSAGCENCYADTQSKRAPHILGEWGPNGTRVVAAETYWKLPARWNRAADCQCGAAGGNGGVCNYCRDGSVRPRVFCASFADVFEDWGGPMCMPNGKTAYKSKTGGWLDGGPSPFSSLLTMADVRRRLFETINATPNLDWLLLTKRPENVARCLAHYSERIDTYCAEAFSIIWNRRVWVGTSVENQATADERIRHLLKIPAAVRFLSCEPLLGPLDLRTWLCDDHTDMDRAGYPFGLSWVIVGGESGQRARPMAIEWARSIVDQCRAAGVPVFVKQLGKLIDVPIGGGEFAAKQAEVMENGRFRLRLVDPKGGDPDAWCADLRIRELPKGVA